MRSGIAQLKNIEDIEIVVEEKSLRFRYDPEEHTLQEIAKAIRGEGNRFGARLRVMIDLDPIPAGTHAKLAEALSTVEGVQTVSEPDEKRIVMVSFRPEAKTRLTQILSAAKAAGIPLKDPPKSASGVDKGLQQVW